MALARTTSVALLGLRGALVEVEADLSAQLPGFVLIGLPDAALGEARDRVRAAAANAGCPLPNRKLTVNLSPASLPKHGSAFDLAIALAALAASGAVEPASVAKVVHLGELGLDGRLRPTEGVLAAVAEAARLGAETVMVPAGNADEAQLVPGVRVVPVVSLREAAIWHGAEIEAVQEEPLLAAPLEQLDPDDADLAEVIGNEEAIHALLVAAAGGHHLLMLGPPGAGKSMLAARLPGLLPDLDTATALEVSALRSLSGIALTRGLDRRPPFEAPHHSATAPALIGGGSGQLRPGAAARATGGVLFLDEATEFPASVLDTLRQPLETGRIRIHRARATAEFPGRFQLVLAANPCPCGLYGAPGDECTCSPALRRRYLGRLSGPLLDRIDLQLRLRRITAAQLRMSRERPGLGTDEARSRVVDARARAERRLAGSGFARNSELPGSWLRGDGRLPRATTADLDRALERGLLTMRGYDRVLRVCCTPESRNFVHMNALRAGLYLRQSIDEPEGIARQRQKTSEQARLRDYEVVAVYEDNATSASKSRSNSRWAQMLDDATEQRGSDGRLTRGRKIDVVIAVDLDRLLRSVTDLGELIKSGVKVLTVDGEIDLTTADGEFRASMLAAIARFEVRRKSERQKRANETRAAQGKRVGGRRPFGYEADGITVREDEASAIRLGYDLLANEKKSLGDVARFWNAEGHTTGQNGRLTAEQKAAGVKPQPSSWTRSGVRQVMLNRRNIGQMVYLGEIQAAPAEWAPLVSNEIFETVHALLTQPGRRTPGAAAIHLLTGIAECGVCGGAIHAGAARRKGSKEERRTLAARGLKTLSSHRTYRCKDASHFARSAEVLDAYIEANILWRLAQDSAVELLRAPSGAGAMKLRDEEKRLRGRLDALAAVYAEGDDDPVIGATQFRDATRSLNRQIAQVQSQLADLGRVDLLGEFVLLDAPSLEERGAAIKRKWANTAIEKRRAVVEELLRIQLHPPGRGVRSFRPETVELHWLRA